MREAEIKALLVDPFNNAPVILLKDRHSTKAMPISRILVFGTIDSAFLENGPS